MSLALSPGGCVGPYEVRGRLGSGALGVVYRARQASLDRDVALKILSPALTVDDELVERFQREARTAAALRHPNIVVIYDTGFADGYHYIAMELLAGRTLSRLDLPLAPAAAGDIVRQLADALAYAHREGVIHRDLKPENVLIDDTGHVTLTDFGIARVVGQASLTLGGGPIGTPEFMAPEQAHGESDARSDVYSLGLTLYYLVVGHSPFLSESAVATLYRQIHEPLPALPAGVPAPLRDWIQRCTPKSPASRFPSAGEALAALRPALASLTEAGDGGLHETPALQPADGSTNPLDAILRGELSLSDALTVHREREAEIRSTFQRDVTALNLDVVRSTLLKEPGQTILASFTFNSLRRQVQDIVHRHSCLASSWTGDGLMALFLEPRDAVEAADEILANLDAFNRSQSGLTQAVCVRIGIHSGRILMTEGQTLGEVASPTLDTAGKLQKNAPPDSVLISQTVFNRLGGAFGFVAMPPVPGVSSPVFGRPAMVSAPSAAGESGREFDLGAASVPPNPVSPMDGPASAGTLVQSGLPMPVLPPSPPLHPAFAAFERGVPGFAGTPAWLAEADSAGVGAAVAGWSFLFFVAAICTLAHAGEAVVLSLWIVAIIWAASVRRQRARIAPLTLTLSILGLVLSATSGAGAVVPLSLMLPLAIFAGIFSLVGERRSRRLRSQREYVVLEPTGSVAALPPGVTARLLAEIGQQARALGFGARQLGLQIHTSLEGPVLEIQAVALHRDGETVLASTKVRGDVGDAEGLATDVARKLSAQLTSTIRALPPGRR